MSFYLSEQKISQLSETESINDGKNRTFVFPNEGHTLGNALKVVMSNDPNINFCGFTVPHPSESTMHFRIQVNNGTAMETLKKAFEDVSKMCDHILMTFDKAMDEHNSDQ